MRPAVTVALCVGLPLLTVTARMAWEGRAALREAEALSRRADPEATALRIAALGRAARRLGGPAGEARAQLRALGRAGTPEAWEALRAAILATRWLITPDRALLDEADAAIAARRALAIRGPAAPDLAAETVSQRARLDATAEPSRPWSVAALAGLLLFAGGVAAALARVWRTAAVGASALGLGLLLLGLWRA